MLWHLNCVGFDMSKWYKVETREDLTPQIIDEIKEKAEDRVKVRFSRYYNKETKVFDINWIFKFKNEIDAVAFKLRWS